jgi:sirohydrochlorin cobaltochelatase
MHGLLLFAHGARDPAWARPFERIAEHLRAAAPELNVGLAFLELMQPRLGEAADVLVAQGCTQITVVPLFLGAGGHVRRDLPLLLDELRLRHPHLSLRATAAIGEIDSVTQALATATLALLGGESPGINAP